jgi:hypothetical protein
LLAALNHKRVEAVAVHHFQMQAMQSFSSVPEQQVFSACFALSHANAMIAQSRTLSSDLASMKLRGSSVQSYIP